MRAHWLAPNLNETFLVVPRIPGKAENLRTTFLSEHGLTSVGPPLFSSRCRACATRDGGPVLRARLVSLSRIWRCVEPVPRLHDGSFTEPATHRIWAGLGLAWVPLGPLPSLILTGTLENFQRGRRGGFLGSLAAQL